MTPDPEQLLADATRHYAHLWDRLGGPAFRKRFSTWTPKALDDGKCVIEADGFLIWERDDGTIVTATEHEGIVHNVRLNPDGTSTTGAWSLPPNPN